MLLAAMLAVSASAGWAPDRKLSTTDSAATLNENMGRCVVTCADTVHVVWFDTRNNGSAIYYKRSSDQGTTWGPDTRLSGYPGAADFPTLARSGSTLHLAFRDQRSGQYGAYYKRSPDGGRTWDPDVFISEPQIYNWWPAIAAVESLVYVALNEDSGGNSEVYFRRSPDNGATWSPLQRISNAPGRSEDPCIAAAGSCIHIVWNEFRDGNCEVYYRRSSDRGVSWGLETRLTNAPQMSYSPTVCLSDSYVDIAWEDNRNGDFDVYHKRSTDYGLTWGPDERLTQDTSNSFYPSIVVEGLNIHMVWFDASGRLFYLHSTDGGATWAPLFPLVTGPGRATRPFLALADSVLHVVWSDDRDGHGAIYYKRNFSGNTAVAEMRARSGADGQPATRFARGALLLPQSPTFGPQPRLLDACGRKVLNLAPGANDVGPLAPGVYFMLPAADRGRPPVKVVIQH
jgi:hypothetical protein